MTTRLLTECSALTELLPVILVIGFRTNSYTRSRYRVISRNVFPGSYTILIAEEEGLEPTLRSYPKNGLANRCSTNYAYSSLIQWKPFSTNDIILDLYHKAGQALSSAPNARCTYYHLLDLVGKTGFEPMTSASQMQRSSLTELLPEGLLK